MDDDVRSALRKLRSALSRPDDKIEVTLSLPRGSAEKVLHLLEAEGIAGAVVVPVKEQFTTTEAAKMLGISRSTLMKLITSGEIDSVKVATHHRIPAPALHDYELARSARLHRAAETIEGFATDIRTGYRSNVTFGGA